MPVTELDRLVSSGRAAASRLRAASERAEVALRVRLLPLQVALTELRRPAEDPVPYAEAKARLAPRFHRATLLGFVGTVLVLVGASFGNSPFTDKDLGAWFFGIPAPSIQTTPGYPVPTPGSGLFLGVVAVYGGMLLLIRAWYEIVRLTTRHPGVPVSRLVPIFALWVAPLLVVAPLFSHDLYSYAGQGEMMSRHINPYLYGTGDLGSTSIYNLVDPLWQHVTSPYGPVFLVLAGWIVVFTHHDPLSAIVGLRLLALAGTLMFAFAIPVIARSFGRDGGIAFTLAALNPLILLHLVGGGHNDALMIGLLAVGYAAARRGHPVVGIVLCALGAVVKVPAIVGVIYIGWDWLGPDRSPRERLRPLFTAGLIAAAVMGTASEAAHLGWGWISGLSNPDTIRSWLDPATAIGLFAGRVIALIGLGHHGHLLLTVARGTSMIVAFAIALRLLFRSDELGPLRALGWTLVAFAMLGPVVQPWYLTWGFVFLAPVVEGTARKVLCVGSAAASFLGLPGGFVLVHEVGRANPLFVALTVVALAVVGAVLVTPRLGRIRESLQTARAVAAAAGEREVLGALSGGSVAAEQ